MQLRSMDALPGWRYQLSKSWWLPPSDSEIIAAAVAGAESPLTRQDSEVQSRSTPLLSTHCRAGYDSENSAMLTATDCGSSARHARPAVLTLLSR